MTRTVEVQAPAKVNLYLRVIERRPDGFHDLDTLFQAVSLADVVRVTAGASDGAGMGDDTRAGPAGGVGASSPSHGDEASDGPPTGDAAPAGQWVRSAAPPIQLSIDGPDVGPLESNLAYRAARRFQELVGLRAPLRIELEKRIPMGAGLGGGSSDAAAVLKALAALTDFRDDDALHDMALDLGSDVPFFLGTSPLARGRGRGEVLTPLTPLDRGHLVLALPDVHVSTAEAYAALAASRTGSDDSGAGVDASRRGTGGGGSSGDDDGRWTDPSTWSEVQGVARNDFEAVVVPRHDEIRRSLQALRDAGATVALLSGSGAASFGLFGGRLAAEEAAARLSRAHPWPFVAVSTREVLPEPTVVETGGSDIHASGAG